MLKSWIIDHCSSLQALEAFMHLDTMLFILGLTFYVAALTQTQLLDVLSHKILRFTRGRLLPSVLFLCAIMAIGSAALGGVSLIGVMIRMLVILLTLGNCERQTLIFSVLVSTVISTVCGVFLAYGEPPNLIMKANLAPHLTNLFFFMYGFPVAVGSFLVVAWHIRRRIAHQHVVSHTMTTKLHWTREQWIAMSSFAPFLGMLVWHSRAERLPLCVVPLGGFAVAFAAIAHNPAKCKQMVVEAWREYKGYFFLFPFFIGISFLQETRLFPLLANSLKAGINHYGVTLMAQAQYVGTCFLSAFLDNNIVADAVSRALQGLPVKAIHLSSMAQMVGYAAGGCWTSIGSAQSIVAYGFIRREIDVNFTPLQWIRKITVLLLQISGITIALIFLEGLLLRF